MVRNLIVVVSLISLMTSGSQGLAQASKTQAISLYNLGLTAYHQGSPESAIIFFKRATDIDPDLADAQYNLGVLYQSEKRLKEAVPRFQEVLRTKPTDADAHYQLGLAYLDLGQPAQAKDSFMTIAPTSPHFGDAQKKLAALGGAGQAPGTQEISLGQATTQNYSQAQTQVATPPVQQQVQQPVQQVQPVQQQAVVPPPPPPTVSSAPPAALLPNSTVRVVATNFSAPAGLAFDKQGTLYVANFTNNTIDRISADGTRSQFSQGINLKGPIGLVADDWGNLYVANYLGGFITRINPAGISSIIATGFKKPYYLAIDREGALFCSQQEDNSVVRVTLPHPAQRQAATPTQATR